MNEMNEQKSFNHPYLVATARMKMRRVMKNAFKMSNIAHLRLSFFLTSKVFIGSTACSQVFSLLQSMIMCSTMGACSAYGKSQLAAHDISLAVS